MIQAAYHIRPARHGLVAVPIREDRVGRGLGFPVIRIVNPVQKLVGINAPHSRGHQQQAYDQNAEIAEQRQFFAFHNIIPQRFSLCRVGLRQRRPGRIDVVDSTKIHFSIISRFPQKVNGKPSRPARPARGADQR